MNLKQDSQLDKLFRSALFVSQVGLLYIRDIRDGIYRRVSNVCVTPEKAQELQSCQIEPGDVLVTKVGDPPGVAAVYPKGMPTGIVTQDVIKIRVNPNLAIPEYLVYFLNSPEGFEARKPIIVETTRARFGLTQFKEVEIPLPPLEEQKRIASIAQKCDRLRRTRRYTQQLSDGYLRSVFLEMFGDFLELNVNSKFGDVLEVPLNNGAFEKNEKYGFGTPVIWVDDLYHTISINTSKLRRARLDE